MEAKHKYTDKNGHLLFYRLRMKHPKTKGKWIRPIYLVKGSWTLSEPKFDGEKPLYMLAEITSNPGATIWVCEGEWAADHLDKFFKKQKIDDENIATTSGSATSASKVDWSPLTNHEIVIWPDYDEPGRKYAKDVADKLSTLNCDVELVVVEALNLPEKGDAVDWLSVNQNAGLTEFESIKKIQPNFEEPIEPLFDISEASVVDFLVAPPPPRIYLLEECLPMGKVGLLVGMGGVRKSQFMLQTQIAIATGKLLCGHWFIGERGNTLGLYAEEDTEELHRRLYYATEGLNKKDKKLIEERVHIKSMTGHNNQMVSKELYEVVITDFVERLIKTTMQIPDLKLIILDPASRFRGGDENSSADATRFVEACELVVKETNASVLIVHHANKASAKATEKSQNASRGSSALVDGVRWVMNLDVMSKDEANKFGVPDIDRKRYVNAEVTKNNYAPPQTENVWLELTAPHGILKYVNLTSETECKAQATILKIIKKIEENAAKGIEHSKSKFAKEYSGKDGIFEIGDQGLRGLIEQAIEKGLLTLKPPKEPTKNVTEVLVVADNLKEPEFNGSIEDLSDKL